MKLKSVALAAALAVFASASFADDQNITLTSTGAGTFFAPFTATHSTSGLFVDSFVFGLPGGFGNPLGSASLTFAALSGSVSLVVATLDAANGSAVASPPDPESIAFPSTLSLGNAMAPFTLTVLGFAGDPFADPTALNTSYSGSFTFSSVAAIPEPETYALMMLGLGALGAVYRRRRERTGLST